MSWQDSPAGPTGTADSLGVASNRSKEHQASSQQAFRDSEKKRSGSEPPRGMHGLKPAKGEAE